MTDSPTINVTEHTNGRVHRPVAPGHRERNQTCGSSFDAPCSPGSAAVSGAVSGDLNTCGIRVLIVDDHPDCAHSLGLILETFGYEVATAYDGEGGLYEAQRFQPQICLLDLEMPVMDGYELAQRLRAMAEPGSELRLIALTGSVEPSDRQRARLAGFDAHLQKPAPIDVLLAALALPER